MPVDFEAFLAQLRRKDAADLTSHLKTFLARFSEHPNVLQGQRKLVASFLEYIYGESIDHPAFAGATEHDPPDVENIREGWEKLVMSKIHDRVFGAPGTDEAKSNAVLSRKFESFKWIEERHLDIPYSFNLSLEVAQAELLRINGFKSPRDKLVILQNVQQLVADLIKKHSVEGDSAGNDNLLPTLILVVIRAAPPNMISNIKYIMRFRNSQEMERGPNQYCMTNVMGAISFIYNMTAKSLTLSDEEKATLGISSAPQQPNNGPGAGQHGAGWRQSTGAGELNRIAGQMSQFFGSIFKEVRTIGSQAAEDFAGLVAGDSTASTTTESTPASSAQHGTMPAVATPSSASGNPPELPPRGAGGEHPAADYAQHQGALKQLPAHLQGQAGVPKTLEEQEEFEFQLALALSLSEQQTAEGEITPELQRELRAIDEAVERQQAAEAHQA
ncbi:hypothetical protein HK105_202303 [Polyrhizophydium stewartii]|uniref:VPS9 domain-containing protein n=1 Tax=Polyrhizophydium stewartii TaxID=2732419 RepID=A0ABR4NED6_9FUNG